MTDALKPCPFCGKDPLSYAIEPHEHSPALKQLVPDLPNHHGSHVIECVCGAGFIDETLELCAAKWNRRVHHDVLPWDSAKHQEQPQQEHEAIPLRARIAELEAKLAEAQKDAARLDYVATGKVTVSRDNGGFQLAWYDHNSQKLKWQNSWHETARAAIDAALAAEERAHGITED